MMKIVCPYTDLNPATEMALKIEHKREVEFVDVSGSQEAYFELMRQYWREGEAFAVVEHDIVPWPGAIKALFDCPEPICAYEAPYGVYLPRGEVWFGCGLVRYGQQLIARFPDHLEDPSLTRLWHKVDGEVTWRFFDKGGPEMHWHYPAVLHLSQARFKHWINAL